MMLWASLAIVSGVYLGAFESNPHIGWSKFWKGCGFISVVYGILLMIGAASGHEDPWQPLAPFASGTSALASPSSKNIFTVIHSEETSCKLFLKKQKRNENHLFSISMPIGAANCKELDIDTFQNQSP